MTTPSPTGPPSLTDSPLVLLAALVAARRSGDRALECIIRRRLDRLGICITFGAELPPDPPKAKGAKRG